jgi:hypothetical protein
MSHREPIPGESETMGDPSHVKPYVENIQSMKGLVDRGVVLLSTATITDDNLYANGLFQNVVIFYRMFDAMGYAPILIVNTKPKALDGIPEPLRRCRTIVMDEILRQPMPNIVALLEIGMSLDPLVRKFVKMLGGRLIKVYLGNILNIDVETPIFVPQHHFAHHVVGHNDLILVSPHYAQHADYASCLNHVPPAKDRQAMIAPYVWDANFLTRDGKQHLRWRRPATSEEQSFVIMEPNISFQKASIVPLLILEKWYRTRGKAAGWKGRIHVVNGERLEMVPHFVINIKPYLEIFKDDRVELLSRNDILSTLKAYPTSTFVLHNYNNEYNYMTMELLYAGFPVLHNSPTWSEYGYYYEGANLDTGAQAIQSVLDSHAEREETYAAHAATLSWRHSPYNPENQAIWRELLEGPLPERTAALAV